MLRRRIVSFSLHLLIILPPSLHPMFLYRCDCTAGSTGRPKAPCRLTGRSDPHESHWRGGAALPVRRRARFTPEARDGVHHFGRRRSEHHWGLLLMLLDAHELVIHQAYFQSQLNVEIEIVIYLFEILWMDIQGYQIYQIYQITPDISHVLIWSTSPCTPFSPRQLRPWWAKHCMRRMRQGS